MTTDEKQQTQITVRYDVDLLAAIDRRAKDTGLSRNEWVVRCTRWAIHNLPTPAHGKDPEAKRKFMESAPKEVAGTRSEDMGLADMEGK